MLLRWRRQGWNVLERGMPSLGASEQKLSSKTCGGQEPRTRRPACLLLKMRVNVGRLHAGSRPQVMRCAETAHCQGCVCPKAEETLGLVSPQQCPVRAGSFGEISLPEGRMGEKLVGRVSRAFARGQPDPFSQLGHGSFFPPCCLAPIQSQPWGPSRTWVHSSARSFLQAELQRG